MAPHRDPVSREASFTTDARPSRRTSTNSANSDVFSDEHAYSDGDLTPVDSIQDSFDLSLGPRDHNAPHITTDIPRSALPLSFNSADRPLSTAKRTIPSASILLPRRNLSVVTNSDASTHRTFSTSSRFSIPRSQSPYNGPTAPSQPYAMYPQVTRASSIASNSTLRPPERPFVPQGGPEHPYGMYQNTVPEEDDDDDEHSPHVPLGFPALGNGFREGSSSSGNDTGDIVGTDGHIEHLPPYSRYADNVIAKGDMGRVDPPAETLVESTSAQSDPARSESALQLNRPRTLQMEEEEQVARKEGWIAKSKKRRCCGMPLWAVILMCLVVFAAAAMGGIIGGVIGNDKGTDRAIASSAATTTVWLDANPASTGALTPSCPTGHFTIPLNNTAQIGSCVDNNNLGITWDCMNEAYLGISLFEHGPGENYTVAFDDYSVRPQQFQYGPQPPDFNGTAFELKPVTDKEDDHLGVAMFFSHLFDKLIILEPDALAIPDQPHKRSVPAHQIRRRGYSPSPNKFLAVADKPWYCFWNATIEEFWIFLEKDVYPTSASSAGAMKTSSPASSITPPPPDFSPTHAGSPSGGGYGPAGATTATQTNTGGSAPTSTWAGPKAKRSSPYSDPNGAIDFPLLVKMVEKRKPHGNIQPYCQQMQVLNNWQILPVPDIPTICIEENEFAQPTGSSKRWASRKRGNPTQELESDCICEWFSTSWRDAEWDG